MREYLKNVAGPSATWLEDEQMLHVTCAHTFIRAVGYLKYVLGKESHSWVLYRGQSSLYESLRPSLFRGIRNPKTMKDRENALMEYIELTRSNGKAVRSAPEHTHEALLQHYGIRTRWLDVVDNAWIALWFACYEANDWGKATRVLHFEQRKILRDKESYCYVILLRASFKEAAKSQPGVYNGNGTEIIDLRVAAPSIYLRPHAQHGLLVRRSSCDHIDEMECDDMVAGIIRVPLADALKWLGKGRLLTTSNLFPSGTYDFGYQFLLDNAPGGNNIVGHIQSIGA